jgi:ferredoxin
MEKKAYIDPCVCVGSPFCLTYLKCPNDAIIREPVDFEERYFDISNEGEGPMVSRVIIEKCKACGTCVAVCPHMAAKLRE